MNVRIKKKRLKAKLELENQILDQEIANLNVSLKKKEAKLRQKQAQIRALEALRLPEASKIQIKTRSAKSYIGTHSLMIGSDNMLNTGAILKKYHEYIDKGLIKKQSFLNKYEAADWFSENLMTDEMLQEAIDQADEWLEKRQQAHLRFMEDLKAGRLYDFGF